MTDILIYKYTDERGRYGKYYLRKNGTIHLVSSNGFTTLVTPDTLIGLIRMKTWSGRVYLNVDALKRATGVAYI
jgi:hypothetical protein